MSTYGEKVKEYEAAVKKALEVGVEPPAKYVHKLSYYVRRAEAKGVDHERTFWEKLSDRANWHKNQAYKSIPDLLKLAAKLLVR